MSSSSSSVVAQLPSADQVRHALQSNENMRQTLSPIFLLLDNGSSAAATACTEVSDAVLLLLDVIVNEFTTSTQTQTQAPITASSCESLVDFLWFVSYAHYNSTNTSDPENIASSSSSSSSSPVVLVALLKLLKDRLLNNSNNNSSTMTTTRNKNDKLMAESILACLPARLLEEAGWILSDKDLAKKLRQYNTQAFYKQHRFNLLAEESQGYSKFLYHLVHISSSSQSCNSSSSNKVVEEEDRDALQIMGTFSLDPNRCVDLVIDVMVWRVTTATRTLATTATTGTGTTTLAPSFSSSSSACLSWDALNATLAPFYRLLAKTLSTRHLAPLLAFKLQQPNQNESTSNNKISLWQVLVWLTSHHHHHHPRSTTSSADGLCVLLRVEDMLDYFPACKLPQVYQQRYQVESKRIQSLGRVRLSSTATSEDQGEDTVGSSTAVETLLEECSVLQWVNVFLQLRQFHLIEPSFTEDWWSMLCFLYPHLGVQILECAVHDKLISLNQDYHHPEEEHPGTMVNHKQRNDLLMLPPWSTTTMTTTTDTTTHPETATTAMNDVDNDGEKANNDDDNPYNNVLELIEGLVKPLKITYESGCIALTPTLFCTLCRFVTAAHRLELQQHPQHNPSIPSPKSSLSSCLEQLIESFLLPSLSLFPSNPAFSHEVWNTLQNRYSYATRYRMYHAWRCGGGTGGTSNKPLWCQEGNARALKTIRYSLKRLSKDTIRDQSRAVAKCCHSHPLVVFTTILGQIESYDNLVSVMVDALRYVTPLSLDVLSSCILSRLSSSSGDVGGGGGVVVNRSRLKEDGVNLSQWLQSLEAFVGAFYKRFPSVDYQGLLCYLMHRLKDGHAEEIGLLRTLLKTSAGWAFCDYSPAASLSSSQLDGRAGSSQLKRETMSFGVVEALNPRASEKVRHVLQSNNIGICLLLLLAQVRHRIVFGGTASDKKPVKLIAHLVDSCQVVMVMLLDFLTNPGSIGTPPGGPLAAGAGRVGGGDDDSALEEALTVYASSLPSLQNLSKIYGLDYASSWMLCRPLIRAATWRQLEREAEAATDNGDGDDNEEDGKVLQPMEVEKAGEGDGGAAVADNWMWAFRSSEDSHKLYREMLPATTWSHITTDLFEAFFTNSLYDIVLPEDVYTTEIARLEKQAERLMQQKPAAVPQSIQPGMIAPRNDEEEANRIKRVAARLATDLEKQRRHVAAVRKHIASQKALYFVSEQVSKESASEFLSRCLYPRCMQGPDEALYCASFISILHEQETPGFGTLHLLDSLIVALSHSLFGLTEGEAANVSILLYEIWKVVSRWRYQESAFEEQVSGKPGSYMMLPNQEENNSEDQQQQQPVSVSHKEYSSLYNKWHAAIGASAIGCLKSSQYIHLRNCLIVLTRVVEEFPTRPGLANKLLETLEPLQDEKNNAFADIRASAQAYSSQLLRARDDGVWKEESAASIRARQERGQSAAAARHKQAKLLMEEITREAAQISVRIGDGSRDSRGWDRGGDRRRDGGGITPPPPLPRRLGSGQTFEPPHNAAASSSSSSLPRGQTSGGASGSSSREPPRDDRRATSRDRPSDASSVAAGAYASIISGSSGAAAAAGGGGTGGGGGGGSGSRSGRDEGGGPQQSSSRSALDDRWQRAGGGDRDSERGSGGDSRKRSRPPSPVEEGEATTTTRSDSQRPASSGSSKRSRVDSDDGGTGSRSRSRSRNKSRRS